MWYILTNGILAALVLFDAARRQMKSPPLWGIATFLLGPVALAFYLSRRPLMADEARTGGFIWNLAKNFSFTWSLLMLLLAISQLMQFNNSDGIMQTMLRQAGLTLATPAGLIIHAKLWLGPIVALLVVGLLFRRRRIAEIGPTGPLAWSLPHAEESTSTGIFIGLPTR